MSDLIAKANTVTIGFKGNIATRPFSQRSVEVKTNSGFGVIAHKNSLEGLEVVFGNGEGINPGDTVWVKPDGSKSWGNDPVEVLGETVIICNPNFVLLVTKKHIDVRSPPYPVPTRAPGPGILT